MEGIKETKELLEFSAGLINAIGKVNADGKIDLSDALAFFPLLTKVGPALADISKIKGELSDLSEEENQALSAYFKTLLDIPDDKIEGYLEVGLAFSLNLARLFMVHK